MASDGTVTIRLAGLDDAPAVGDMAHRLLLEIDTPRYGREQYAETARTFLADGAGFFVLLAVTDGAGAEAAVGMMTISESTALYAGGRYAEIQEFFVDGEHRGHGIGNRLLHAAEDLARARGWERLQLHVSQERDGGRSYAFYRRNGFEESGTTMRYRLTAAAG